METRKKEDHGPLIVKDQVTTKVTAIRGIAHQPILSTRLDHDLWIATPIIIQHIIEGHLIGILIMFKDKKHLQGTWKNPHLQSYLVLIVHLILS
jgi:hypothetical protein